MPMTHSASWQKVAGTGWPARLNDRHRVEARFQFQFLLGLEVCAVHLSGGEASSWRRTRKPLAIAKAQSANFGQRSLQSQERECILYDLHSTLVPYSTAWAWQKALVSQHHQARLKDEETPDAVVILQHPPVYTLGTRSSLQNLKFDKDNPPCELHVTERGGEVTYHGPGQLVVYPILDLRKQQTDLHWYLRSLEEVVILALQEVCAIEAGREPGLTGVWVGNSKLAAIGVRVSKWVTYHGLALNVCNDLTPFNDIVPCGISDRSVGSVKDLLQKRTSYAEGKQEIDCDNELLAAVSHSLKTTLAKVFQLNLVDRGTQALDVLGNVNNTSAELK